MNYTSRNLKLYPKDFNKLPEQQIIKICTQVQKASWGPCLYNWNDNDNALELLYVKKYRSDYLAHDKILKNFHYWEIEGDEGNASDLIIGQSTSYQGDTQGINRETKNNYCDYGKICNYQSDEMIITGNSKKVNEILKEVFLDKIILDSQFRFRKAVSLNYKSCSDRICIDNYSNKEVVKFEIGNHLFEDGRIHEILSGEFEGMLFRNEKFRTLFNAMENNSIIDKIEFLYNNRVTHKYYYENGAIRQKTGDFWDNCIDTEYLNFNKWYKSNLN